MRIRTFGLILFLLIGTNSVAAQEIQERQGVLGRDVAQLKIFLTTP